MSVPGVATSTSLRTLVPSVTSVQPSSGAVRWMLRLSTLVIFAVATLIGVSVGLAAPTETPAALSGPHR